jgi:PAS domain S-box-containing protein
MEQAGKYRSDDAMPNELENAPLIAAGDARTSLFVGDGEMGTLMRSLDWSRTPLGPVETWPQSLRMMVRYLLANRFPLMLWWGPEYACIYNDAYRPILGRKHPASLGQPVREVWHEIWHVLQPLIDTPFNGGPSTWMEDIPLELNRHGFVEETHFTIAYSPVPDEAAPRGIGGVIATVHEITEKVVGERRTSTLRDLGARSAEAKTAEEACASAAQILSTHAHDVPFALLYLNEGDGTRARLAGAAGVAMGEAISPHVVALTDGPSPASDTGLRDALKAATRTGTAQTLDDLASRFEAVPAGPWSDPPRAATVLPVPSNRADHFAGVLVAGLSSRLAFDERYRTFLDLLTAQVATAIANARAYEEERQRAEALAELDRAKTAFFANVSHEFRTPLTLLLGPLEETLRRKETIAPDVRDDLTAAHRNALRLLRLVNSLLDFSRIEAGRVEAVFEPTPLASYTAELVSTFRSATDRAGLGLEIIAEEVSEPVWVDRAMWEKIVLNLVSNAFKHTFEGTITATLRTEGGTAVLEVRDTGVGIPDDQLPHLFERFHRVPNARSRTHEGTGIGLALVRELVRLHGGSIDVTSRDGAGTTFRVTIPLGTSHLPREQLVTSGATPRRASIGLGAAAWLEEALRWLPSVVSEPAATEEMTVPSSKLEFLPGTIDQPDVGGSRVLLADDNSDLRDYVARLLRSQGWTVDAVTDGLTALQTARARVPDLVLTDVMMPGLDGFALLRELRNDPRTANVPVVVLSARAGEESRVEGAASGADDYLVKPFSAQELVARVGVHLRLARQRRDTELALRSRTAQFETLLNEAPLGVFLVDGNLRIREVNPVALPAFADIPDLIGRDLDEIVHIQWPAEYADEIVNLFRHTLETGEPYYTPERIEERRDIGVTEYYEWQINRITLPEGGYGVVCYFRDISAQVHARHEAEQAREQAEAANRTKSEFLAVMSHELRTPLNAIAGYVQLIDMEVHGPVTDEQREALSRIQRSGKHLLSLINDVLNFAKLEAGRVEYEPRDLALIDAVAAVSPMIDSQLRARKLAYEVHVDPRAVVYADWEKLQQVLLNLLSNAVKFTAPGGRITVDTPASDQLAGETQADRVLLRVSDTGIGIPRDKLGLIFDPFVQVHRKLTNTIEGSGLGLAISRDLARGMGGDLEVSSIEGEGSAFTLVLPRAS